MSNEDAGERVLALVDEVGEPSVMSASEYVDFLGNLIDDLRTRKTAAEEDIARGAGE